MTKTEINRPGESSTIELKKLVNLTHSIITKKFVPHWSHQFVARVVVDYFGSTLY